MQIKIPTALQQNVFYALGIVIMKSVSFFMLPFVAHMLSPEDFGRLEVLNSLGALGAILVGFGLLNTLFRFASEQTCLANKHAMVADVVGINLSIGSIALLLGLAFAGQLNTLLPGGLGSYNISLAIGMIALEGCIAIPLGWMRMNDRAGLFFALSTGRAIFQAGLVLLFLKLGRGIEGVMEAGLLAAAVQALILIVIQYSETGIRLFSTRFRELLVYSFPLVGSGLLGFVLTGLDRWLLADAMGAAEMAQYAVAAKFAMIAALLLQPFLMWWSPRRFQVLNESNGRNKAADFAALGSALSLLIAVSVGLSAPLFIELLLPETYWSASRYIPWLVLLVAIKDSAELLNLGCYTGRTTHAQFLINLGGSMTGLLGMLLLIPLWGTLGAIAALLLAQLLRLALYLTVSQRQLRLPYPSGSLLLLAGMTLTLLYMSTEVEGLVERISLLLLGSALMLAALFVLRLVPLRAKTVVA